MMAVVAVLVPASDAVSGRGRLGSVTAPATVHGASDDDDDSQVTPCVAVRS